MTLAINYCNNEAAAKETAEAIAELGGESLLVRGDLTLPADVSALIAASQAKWGEQINVLVNVTGGLVARITGLSA